MGCVILLLHSLCLSYIYFEMDVGAYPLWVSGKILKEYCLSVKRITSTSYFSVNFKHTTFRMMEGKLLCSGDILGLANLSDKAN